MQLMGNSRPASGCEHHISHLIEMGPAAFAFSSDALHGEKVGVGPFWLPGFIISWDRFRIFLPRSTNTPSRKNP